MHATIAGAAHGIARSNGEDDEYTQQTLPLMLQP